jgi:hypothetical protein
MLNHYKAMIPHHSHLLTPFTALPKKNVKFEWTTVNIKKPSTHLPTSPFLQNLHQHLKIPNWIHHYQKDKPLAFYSRNLTDLQMRYTVTELELLAIVETLCEYKCILLGHLITIYIDHKNLTFSNFTTDGITCW